MLAATGHEPLGVYQLMASEAFGGERRIAATLTAATPLLLTGLAAAVAFRAGIFNVGVEGCFYLGGIVAAVLGFALGDWPPLLLVPVALAGAAIVGGLWLIGPGILRARLGVDEVVTTLMLNFIAIDLTSWLVNGPLLARGSANSATAPIAAAAELPRLLPPTTLHLGFVISLALVILYGFWSRLAVAGFRSRLVGSNARFSRAVGIDVSATFLRMMVLSGLIGGLAGGIHTLGLVHRFVAGFSPGYGFTGIAIALLIPGSQFRDQDRPLRGHRLRRRLVIRRRDDAALQQCADRDRRDPSRRGDDLRGGETRLRSGDAGGLQPRMIDLASSTRRC